MQISFKRYKFVSDPLAERSAAFNPDELANGNVEYWQAPCHYQFTNQSTDPTKAPT